ncbi:MAG: TfoX/Sxy family protein [Anaerolineae bacterium]|jgi:TfoX/Sxy family transcriptional regulator of competence genes
MAYDEGLAQRIRDSLQEAPGLVEKKMFGGIGYMLQGNMACGVNQDTLIVRVGPDRYEEALSRPHTRVFDMTGRPMKGWVVVAPEGIEEDDDLDQWIQQGVDFALSLPAK